MALILNEGVVENFECKAIDVYNEKAYSDVSGLASHIEDGDLTFEDISVYDILTKEGTTLGLQMSLHTERGLSSIKSRSYEIFEGRNK